MYLVHMISSEMFKSDKLFRTTNFFNMMVNHVYLDHIISSERFESVELLRTNLKWAWIIYILSITSFNEVQNCWTTSNYFELLMYISSTSSVQKSDKLLRTRRKLFNVISNYVYSVHITSWVKLESSELLRTTLKWSLIMCI